MRKLESIFDCSRMMLPEHKQRIIADENKQELHNRPMLDAQEWELIDQALAFSMHGNEPVTISLFNPAGNLKVRGVVLAVDRLLRQIKLQMEYDYEWIKTDDIIGVTE
ncbi:YolD-like protein [compost metagenome]